MSVYGRDDTPGEKGIGDLADQRNVLNRTIRAQVVDVNNDDGYVILNYEGLTGGGRYATVAPLWMSFPQVGGASWGRFMPQRSDLVKVSFDYDDRPHIVGFDVVASKDGVGDGGSGWPQINNLYKAAKANPDAKIRANRGGREFDVSIARYAQFAPLNPGEFDFMSSGGSYVYGTNMGKLYLAGGSVSVALVKNDLLLASSAQLWAHKADDCDFRLGQVRRTNPTTQLEEKVSADSAGAFKEFKVSLLKTTAPGTAFDIANLHMGNVVDTQGVVMTGSLGGALRYLMSLHDDLGLIKHKQTVDINGNYVMESQSASTGAKFDFGSGSFIVNSPSIKFQGPNGTPSASHPLLLTNIYRPAEDTVLQALGTQILTLAAAVQSIALLLQVGGAASTPPVAGAIAMGKIFQAGAAAVTAQATTVISQTPLALTQFTTAASTYTSTIAETG